MTYDYRPIFPPFAFQDEYLQLKGDAVALANFSDQGTGKSYVFTSEMIRAYEERRIDAVLIVAPDAVKVNWELEILPVHMKGRLEYEVFTYYTKTAKTKAAAQQRERILKYRDGLAVVCMSYANFTTAAGKAFAKQFLKTRKVFYILDESHFIKSPGALRTKTILGSGEYAVMRRVGTGTPMGADGPLGVYSQIKFVDPTFWKRHGINDFALFKSFFADWVHIDKGYNKLLGYKNLHLLHEWLKEISVRYMKSEVLKDLPPKLHTRLYYDLPREHQRAYDQMKDELMLELLSGETMEQNHALTALRKLMQLCCGYVKNTETGEWHNIDDDLPRIDMAVEWADASEDRSIIWCRDRHAVNILVQRLGSKASRLDGKLDEAERTRQLRMWRDGTTRDLVANAKVGGAGLTLVEANRVLFYGVDVDPTEFKQAQDRCHRPGQHNAVNYTYLLARNTCDQRIVQKHIEGEDVIQQVLGGKLMEII